MRNFFFNIQGTREKESSESLDNCNSKVRYTLENIIIRKIYLYIYAIDIQSDAIHLAI